MMSGPSEGLLPSALPLLAPLLLLARSTMANDPTSEPGEVKHFEVFHFEWDRVEVPYVIFVWILVTTAVKIGFQKAPGVKNYFPESSILIVVGFVIGLVLFVADYTTNVITLTPDIFFLFLLPPIIGEAGYFMPNRLFFDQLGTILLMAVVGTIFNMFTIGGCVAFMTTRLYPVKYRVEAGQYDHVLSSLATRQITKVKMQISSK